jgi:hypothetical protein
MSKDPRIVTIEYTNWRGERRRRQIIPMSIDFRLSAYHPGTQWILTALDPEDDLVKDFAMNGLHGWDGEKIKEGE